MIRLYYTYILALFIAAMLCVQGLSGQQNDPLKQTAATSQEISIYPNPAYDVVHISAPSDVSVVRVYSILGQMVKEKVKMDYDQSFDVSDLQQGMYLVRFIDQSGKIKKTLRLQKK